MPGLIALIAGLAYLVGAILFIRWLSRRDERNQKEMDDWWAEQARQIFEAQKHRHLEQKWKP